MNQSLYTLALYLLSPVIWLYFLYRGFKDKRYWLGFKQRLGISGISFESKCLHIHCASVGETLAAIPLIEQLIIDFPQYSILITTTTPTGRAEVQKLIAQNDDVSIYHSYLPIDWLGSTRRFVSHMKPAISILMETELWPNLLSQLVKNNIPILLANARMSDKSLKKYSGHLKLSQQIFANLSIIAAQYPSDAANFVTLSVAENKVHAVGNLKFEIKISEALKASQQAFSDSWKKERLVWIAASIHPAEFEQILNTHKQLLLSLPELLLIAVPRHPEAFESFKSTCRKMNLKFVCRSENIPPEKHHQVFVGDSMGELTMLCGAADIAFVGGSLIERGGHNPLEPAACGVPVIMGASDYNFSDVCRIMKTYQTLDVVNNQQDLQTLLEELLSNKTKLHARALLTSKLMSENSGTAEKISLIVRQLLNAC